MNAAKWHASTDPVELLAFLGGKRGRGTHPHFEELIHRCGERKLLLFGVACCRRLWGLLDPVCRDLICKAEDCAEGKLAPEQLHEAHESASLISMGVDVLLRTTGELPALGANRESDPWADLLSGLKFAQRESGQAMFKERIEQAQLVREVFGNPFRCAEFPCEWRTEAVARLARTAFDEHAWHLLPVLADALEKAGCFDGELLRHCRQGGSHYRGCWATDLVLGKSLCGALPAPAAV